MAVGLRRWSWKAGCAGLAIVASSAAARLNAAPADDKIVQASAANMAIIDSMIDEAMQDGSISVDERKLIVGVARRKLTASELAQLEARLVTLPVPPLRLTPTKGTTTTIQGNDAAAAAAAAPGTADCCDEAGCGGLFDNMYLFGATDGWMGPIDDDDGNNFGMRFGVNAGVPIDECRGIGAQVGMSYGVYNFHGRDTGNEQSAIEDQIFLTAGLFKRADLCAECPDRIVVGVVYDHMITDNTGEDGWEIGELGQLRYQIGYALSMTDEVGVAGSFRLWEDAVDGSSNQQDDIRALDQMSVYWHHKWCWSADTSVYVGVADDPGEWVFGAKGEVPLSNCVSLFGGAHYVLPSTSGGGSREEYAQEYWNVSVGLAYYRGGNAVSKTVAGRRWMPLMPVADNGTFGIDIHPDRL